MKCKKKGCGGQVDETVFVLLKVSCSGPPAKAHPCKLCGKMHWGDASNLGLSVKGRAGKGVFLSDFTEDSIHRTRPRTPSPR